MAEYYISKALSFDAPGRPGFFCTYYPKGQVETILSIQPDGSKESRPKSAAGGPWESWRPNKSGTRALFPETTEPYVIPLDD